MSEGSQPESTRASTDVVAIVDELLARAIAAEASDVHFEPMAEHLLVRFRLDGLLKDVQTLPKSLGENVITRLKVLGGLLTYRNDIPQEGHLHLQARSGDVVDQRISIFPTIHGQRAVVRLLYAQRSLTQLEELGFSESVLDRLRRLAGQPQGLVLLTGPAGSGKSTTLAAMLRHIHAEAPGKSIVALEDPVERQIEGVTQVQISAHGQMTFPVALRSLLRQDPQVLMIGEIRDAQTAEIAVQAALTGHLLLSTMHSGTPAAALLRLLEMGIEPYQVTSSVAGIVNQRLVRRLCRVCGGRGCEKCFGSGYSGRALLAELVELDGRLRQAVLAKADLDELESILQQRGHMDLSADGRRLVAAGVTSPQEVAAVCPPAEAQ